MKKTSKKKTVRSEIGRRRLLPPRFVQIAAATCENSPDSVYGLDNEGRVWVLLNSGSWCRLSDDVHPDSE